MILGTHNSISYLKPKKWWMRLINFTAKCQDLSIKQQWEYGVRYFDIRISGSLCDDCLAHGLIKYKGNLEDILSYLDEKSKTSKETCYVAINSEEYVYDIYDCNSYIQYFENKLWDLQLRHPHLIICGGYCKGPWRRVVTSIPNPTLFEKYWEFTNYKWAENRFKTLLKNILHFSPRYWAKKNNDQYKKQFFELDQDPKLGKCIKMLDFVQYGKI